MKYDLEERTFKFAREVRTVLGKIYKTLQNSDDIKQVIRSSGSIGANYIEANEALGKKDFLMRIKICRKEAKETCYWLKLLFLNNNKGINSEGTKLLHEAEELTKIFGAIVRKCE